MAIREFSPDGSPRAKIAFVGDMPTGPDLPQFEARNFECVEQTFEQLVQSGAIAQLDAVIWTQDPLRLNELPRHIGNVIPALLDHDVRVYIRLAKDQNETDTPRRLVVNALQASFIPVANFLPVEWSAVPKNLQERENSYLAPSVYIVDSALPWPNIATLVCDRPAGPSPKLGLKFDETSLNGKFQPEGHMERLLLLKRAFWNCSELRLSFLGGGLSGASACKAYASLEAGRVQSGPSGPYPHLYFVKIGPRKKIIAEYDNYCSYMLEYVPFHLGPRLRPERCNLGSTQGILVGDFVDDTESLIDCARERRCGHAIANLFNRTLGGWRKQALPDPARTLGSYLAEKWQVEGSKAPICLPPKRALIVRELGGEIDVAPLKCIFEKHSGTTPLCAPAHGDMHATNVLVRHGDAIMIDFEKMEDHYPLTYDPASLEGGFLVEGFAKDLERKAIAPSELVDRLKRLYQVDTLDRRVESPCPRGDLTEWYFDCVNQIRTLSWAAEHEPRQYALTLALCLIRKGCNSHDGFKEEQEISRAIAFFFGQMILREIDLHPMRPESRKSRSGPKSQPTSPSKKP